MTTSADTDNSLPEDHWSGLDEQLIDDVEILRYIISKQRQKLQQCEEAISRCAEQEKAHEASRQRFEAVVRQVMNVLPEMRATVSTLVEKSKPLYTESLEPDPYQSTAGRKAGAIVPAEEMPAFFSRESQSLHTISEEGEEDSHVDDTSTIASADGTAGKHWHMDLGQLDVSSSQGDSSVLSCLLVVAILTILLFLLVFLVC